MMNIHEQNIELREVFGLYNDWNFISSNQVLSEEFIERYADKVEWTWISIYQELSEGFIERNSGNIHWYWISMYQVLSEEFIERNSEQVDWDWISKNQVLSEGFIKKYNLVISDNNWLYKNTAYKESVIKDCGLYEIRDGYVYGYKSVRNDLRSVCKPSIKYEVGHIYESRCNHNIDESNSYGLSMLTKEGAMQYHSEGKLMRVRSKVSDVGALTMDRGKIRTTRLEVLGVA